MIAAGSRSQNQNNYFFPDNRIKTHYWDILTEALRVDQPVTFQKPYTESLSYSPSPGKPTQEIAPGVGERQQLTLLFSNHTGYTAMSEKLDSAYDKIPLDSWIAHLPAGSVFFLDKLPGTFYNYFVAKL
jgi:hypothetical protein